MRATLRIFRGLPLRRKFVLGARISARAARKTHYRADNDYESWKLPIPARARVGFMHLRMMRRKSALSRLRIATRIARDFLFWNRRDREGAGVICASGVDPS